MSFAVINYIVALLFVLIQFRTCTIPDYIQVCHHDDPDLGGCIKKSIEALRPRLKSGIPELEVPSIEPLHLDIISFKASTEATHLVTNISNIRAYEASTFEILKLIPSLTKNGHKFQFEVIIPQLRVEGDYQVDSKVLLLQLKGDGPFYANLSDFNFNCELKGHKVQRERENHLEFEKMDCNLIIGKISIYLKNLFNGHPVLEKATNDAINDNSAAFFDEIRPSLLSAIRQKFTDIANKITLNFKYEELFP